MRPGEKIKVLGTEVGLDALETYRRVNASEARDKFADVVDGSRLMRDRVVVHRHGRPVAGIVPIEDLLRLEALERRVDAEVEHESAGDAVLDEENAVDVTPAPDTAEPEIVLIAPGARGVPFPGRPQLAPFAITLSVLDKWRGLLERAHFDSQADEAIARRAEHDIAQALESAQTLETLQAKDR